MRSTVVQRSAFIILFLQPAIVINSDLLACTQSKNIGCITVFTCLVIVSCIHLLGYRVLYSLTSYSVFHFFNVLYSRVCLLSHSSIFLPSSKFNCLFIHSFSRFYRVLYSRACLFIHSFNCIFTCCIRLRFYSYFHLFLFAVLTCFDTQSYRVLSSLDFLLFAYRVLFSPNICMNFHNA